MFKRFSYQISTDNFFQKQMKSYDQGTSPIIDELTKLPNLTCGRNIVKDLIEKQKIPFALFAIKISGFSAINTNLGFEIGDQAIYQISQVLKHYLSGKGFLYRLYGNEWEAIILSCKKKKQSIVLAERLIEQIQQPLRIDEHPLYLDANIGISFFHPNQHIKLSTLLQQTHTALQKAKLAGTGQYALYSDEMSIDTFKTFQLETDFFQALENEELHIEYQPKVDLKSQMVTSAEALLRWNHPVWGRISPAEFIPITEKREIIHKRVNEFVIHTVCREMKTWRKNGIKKPNISINLSPKAISNPDLVTTIKTTLKKYRLPPECLTIEIVESTLFQNFSTAKEQIEKLQKLGITFCLDDFGSGYSTLSYVKQFPVQQIKIDRSFIYNLENSVRDRIIVSSIIDVAKKLQIKVCAEGVENRDQLHILQELECDEVQGFYFAPSLPADEMCKWFMKKTASPTARSNKTIQNRRKYFRIKLPLPLSAQMTILTFRRQKVSLGSTEVLIIDISPGGLRFMSHLRLPEQEEIVYNFSTNLDHTSLHVSGKIVWATEQYPGIFEYGVELTISERERNELIQVLFRIMPKLRDNPFFNEGNFINLDPIVYLKKTFLE